MALLFFWYLSPGMRTLRALPEAVAAREAPGAGALIRSRARPVRSAGDSRLTGEETTYALFGLLPLRTVTEAPALPAVFRGGAAAGIVLYTKGVQVVGFTTVDTEEGARSPASAAGLKKGDAILAVDGRPITGALSLSQLIQGREEAALTVRRGEEQLILTLRPAREQSTKEDKLGAYVRESTSGIGTLSFARGERYCALGHAVTDVDTGATLLPGRGFVTLARITAARRAEAGRVGELEGTFSTAEGEALGAVDINGDYGVAGRLTGSGAAWGPELPVAAAAQAQTGDATLYCAADGSVKGYTCRVIRLKVQSAPGVQGMMIEVTDKDLLALTGGIVPGMSGSPVVQNGRLIGVVTHVFVNEPKRGYCVYAQWMLERLL